LGVGAGQGTEVTDGERHSVQGIGIRDACGRLLLGGCQLVEGGIGHVAERAVGIEGSDPLVGLARSGWVAGGDADVGEDPPSVGVIGRELYRNFQMGAGLGGAAQAFAQVLTLEPAHERAIAGMARVYLADGDIDQARQTIAMAPQDSRDTTVQSVRAQLALMSAAPPGADDELQARVAADPADHQARYDLSLAQAASGDLKGAVDSLLTIVTADREWNEQAARKQLLVVFEAAGATSDVARDGRRRLSSILFA
jgi:hypothetical protein